MNGLCADGTALARDLAERWSAAGTPAFDMAVCPPATLISTIGTALGGTDIALGGQDCHPDPKGAHTGDLAAEMLADLGCRYVIVGHSERRADHGEDDATVKAKAAAAHRAGLIAILCIGETEEQRDAGQALDVCARQLAGSLPDGATADNTVIAYEPVWAIGTGRTPTIGDVAEMHAHIRREIDGRVAKSADVRLLYGGSVKPGNAAELLGVDHVNGALVGGASLKAEDFWAIAEASG
jgi:triosephosphate isomerase